MPKPRKAPVVGGGAETAPDGVAALDRAIAILRCFEIAAPVLSLNEISSRTGLYKSTILRLANSLLYAQLLERLPDGRYRIGPTAFQLGAVYRRGVTSGEVLLPIMRELADELGESVAFYVRSGADMRTCLLKVISARHTIHHYVQEGDQLPCAVGSAGRILLAFSGEPGEPYDGVREALFYLSAGERNIETAGISAPVFGPDQALAGALTLAGPRSRFDAPFIRRAVLRVLRMASRATHGLGGNPAPLERACQKVLQAQALQDQALQEGTASSD
jgi:DNA-binding IclR family transcriptional regulator